MQGPAPPPSTCAVPAKYWPLRTFIQRIFDTSPPELQEDYTESMVLVANSYFISGHRYQYLLDHRVQRASGVFVRAHARMHTRMHTRALVNTPDTLSGACAWRVCHLHAHANGCAEVEASTAERAAAREEHGLPRDPFIVANFNNLGLLPSLPPRTCHFLARVCLALPSGVCLPLSCVCPSPHGLCLSRTHACRWYTQDAVYTIPSRPFSNVVCLWVYVHMHPAHAHTLTRTYPHACMWVCPRCTQARSRASAQASLQGVDADVPLFHRQTGATTVERMGRPPAASSSSDPLDSKVPPGKGLCVGPVSGGMAEQQTDGHAARAWG